MSNPNAAKPPPCNTFGIAFEVKGNGGYIKVTKITIEQDVMDAEDTMRVDLPDHPLYPQLEQYVLANRKRRGG